MTISAEVAARLPAVLADRNRLTQVLANLADNAFSYTPAGGSIAFRAWVDEATHEVRIDVVDTGVGFSAEHQKRLFERFLRAENPLVMAKAGTGLGLSISRQLIEAQGGRLWLAQSVEGEGSVFSLTLPLAEAGELAIVSASSRSCSACGSHEAIRGDEVVMAKILVAEDERDIRDLIQFTLEFAGHQVVTAANGEEAVQVAQREVPELILSDVRMPRLSGYEACKLIKADPATAHIPVVFLSAKGQDAEVQSGLDAGAAEYLLKPFAPDQLMAKVAEILARA